MRNGQNKRMRGRNRKGQNPMTRVYESNGPDVKIRGTANHVAEKYLQLARDAQSSGDPVAAENYYQHAEHYFRLIAAMQEQFRQNNPFYRPEPDSRDDQYDEGEDGSPPEGHYGPREPHAGREQHFQPREHQHQQPREHHGREHQPFGLREPQPYGNRPQQQQPREEQPSEGEHLPAFITGSAPQPDAQRAQNGFDNGGGGERFPLHRRRRRHRGPRGEIGGQGEPGEQAPSGPPRD